MPRFEADYDKTFTVTASPATVLATFLDLDVLIAQYGDLASADKVDAQTIHYVLNAQNHGVFSFQGDYHCRYQADGNHAVVWKTQGDGNVITEGRLTVAPADGGTTLHYTEHMGLDIDMNAMLAPMLKPVVQALIPQQIGEFVQRMVKAAEAA